MSISETFKILGLLYIYLKFDVGDEQNLTRVNKIGISSHI